MGAPCRQGPPFSLSRCFAKCNFPFHTVRHGCWSSGHHLLIPSSNREGGVRKEPGAVIVSFEKKVAFRNLPGTFYLHLIGQNLDGHLAVYTDAWLYLAARGAEK